MSVKQTHNRILNFNYHLGKKWPKFYAHNFICITSERWNVLVFLFKGYPQHTLKSCPSLTSAFLHLSICSSLSFWIHDIRLHLKGFSSCQAGTFIGWALFPLEGCKLLHGNKKEMPRSLLILRVILLHECWTELELWNCTTCQPKMAQLEKGLSEA